jgi:hypothetical protein
MWFQGMLWKLPLPVSGGLQYWTEQMASRAAFEFHRELVTAVYLPYLYILNPIIFLAEFTFAVSLILGLGVRLIGVLRHHIRAAPLARHLPARQSRRMAVAIHIPRDRDVLLCAARRRSQPRSRCLAAPRRAAVRDGKGFFGALLSICG